MTCEIAGTSTNRSLKDFQRAVEALMEEEHATRAPDSTKMALYSDAIRLTSEVHHWQTRAQDLYLRICDLIMRRSGTTLGAGESLSVSAPTPDTVALSLTLPTELYQALCRHADAQGQTMDTYVRRLVAADVTLSRPTLAPTRSHRIGSGPRLKTSVFLPRELVAWAKAQPGGLGLVVTRLLHNAWRLQGRRTRARQRREAPQA